MDNSISFSTASITREKNTRLVGSKTMVMILIPLPSPKEVTCVYPMKQYSNRIGNLGMIHVLVVSALRFSCSVLCPCSVVILHNDFFFCNLHFAIYTRLFQKIRCLTSKTNIKWITHNLFISLLKL